MENLIKIKPLLQELQEGMKIVSENVETCEARGVIYPSTALKLRKLELEKFEEYNKFKLPDSYWNWIEVDRNSKGYRSFNLFDNRTFPARWSGIHVSAYTFNELWNMLPMKILVGESAQPHREDYAFKYLNIEGVTTRCYYTTGLHNYYQSDEMFTPQEAVADTFIQIQ